MNKELIMKILGGACIGIVSLEIGAVALIKRKLGKILRVNKAIKDERGLDYTELSMVFDEKLADGEVNEFYVLKEREVKGKKMTDMQVARLSVIEDKLWGEFSGKVVS